MKIVPVIRCSDIDASIRFYTEILGFVSEYPETPSKAAVVDVSQGDAVLQLSVLSGDGSFGAAINVEVEEVDELFGQFLSRGLDTSGHANSPVHLGPIDQSWGSREFYVTDPDGNTLRFRSWPAKA